MYWPDTNHTPYCLHRPSIDRPDTNRSPRQLPIHTIQPGSTRIRWTLRSNTVHWDMPDSCHTDHYPKSMYWVHTQFDRTPRHSCNNPATPEWLNQTSNLTHNTRTAQGYSSQHHPSNTNRNRMHRTTHHRESCDDNPPDSSSTYHRNWDWTVPDCTPCMNRRPDRERTCPADTQQMRYSNNRCDRLWWLHLIQCNNPDWLVCYSIRHLTRTNNRQSMFHTERHRHRADTNRHYTFDTHCNRTDPLNGYNND